jgi:hypothetical protein
MTTATRLSRLERARAEHPDTAACPACGLPWDSTQIQHVVHLDLGQTTPDTRDGKPCRTCGRRKVIYIDLADAD